MAASYLTIYRAFFVYTKQSKRIIIAEYHGANKGEYFNSLHSSTTKKPLEGR